MKAYYERDGITIYHGDCREVLPALGPVDHVITDPPYGVDIYRRMRGNDSEGGNERVCAGGLCLLRGAVRGACQSRPEGQRARVLPVALRGLPVWLPERRAAEPSWECMPPTECSGMRKTPSIRARLTRRDLLLAYARVCALKGGTP